MFTKAFARDLAERTIATFAEAFAVLLAAAGVGVLEVDWVTALSLAAMTALVALLKGVAAGYKDPETGASVLSDPPPQVERGHVDLSTALLVGVVALVVLALLGFFR
jgi:hypothetical protein